MSLLLSLTTLLLALLLLKSGSTPAMSPIRDGIGFWEIPLHSTHKCTKISILWGNHVSLDVITC